MVALKCNHAIYPIESFPSATFASASALIDAAGETCDIYGFVHWDGEPASAKTVSSAGGKITIRFAAVTFADAGTTLRIGIQDVDPAAGPPARGDGTHDVSADLVGGTDTITANAPRETAMETGSKSIAHGDLICIRAELISRVSPDSLQVNNLTNVFQGQPYGVTLNSTTDASAMPTALITADDGTVGWIDGGVFYDSITQRNFDSTTATADEYASIITFPIGMDVAGYWFHGRMFTADGLVKCILYTDPLGTPVIATSVTIDTNRLTTNSFGGLNRAMFPAAVNIPANTKFAVSVQPQDAIGDCLVSELLLGSTITGRTLPFRTLGGTWSKGTRLDATGALTEDVNSIMMIGPVINAIDIPAGGGMLVHPGMSGGLRG